MSPFRVNLGGEGEVPGALNQQGRWVFQGYYSASQSNLSFEQMVLAGPRFSSVRQYEDCGFPDECCDEVITNNLPPADSFTHLGPSVQSSEDPPYPEGWRGMAGERCHQVRQTMSIFFDGCLRRGA